MGAKAWDLNAYFPAAAPVSTEDRKPQARLSRGAAQGQFVIMREELRACSETLTLATSGLLPWRKASSCLLGLNMQQAAYRPASISSP